MSLRQVGRDNVPYPFLTEVKQYAEKIDAVVILNKLFHANGILQNDKYIVSEANVDTIKDLCSRTVIQSYLKAYRIAVNINSKNPAYTRGRPCGNINESRYSKQRQTYNDYGRNINESALSPFSSSVSPSDRRRGVPHEQGDNERGEGDNDFEDMGVIRAALNAQHRENMPDGGLPPWGHEITAVGGGDEEDEEEEEEEEEAVAPARRRNARDLTRVDPQRDTDCSEMNAGEPHRSLAVRLDQLLQCLYGGTEDTTGLRAARPMLSASNIQMIFQPCLSKKTTDEVTELQSTLNSRLIEISKGLKDPEFRVTDDHLQELLRPLRAMCRKALDLNNTLTLTKAPWSPPQVTTTNSMLNDVSSGIDAIRKNSKICKKPRQGEVCKATTETMDKYRELVNYVMNKYSKMYSVHKKDINAHIDQLRFFDINDGNKVINIPKVLAFWSDAMIRAYGKSLQLRSSSLTRSNFTEIYTDYRAFAQCDDDDLIERFRALWARGFERPVKARYASCKGNNSNIAYAANVIQFITENKENDAHGNRKSLLTPQNIKRKYTLIVRRRSAPQTRKLDEKFVYTEPHTEHEGAQLDGRWWRYKKSADDSVLHTEEALGTSVNQQDDPEEIDRHGNEVHRVPLVAPTPRRKLSPNVGKSSDSPSNSPGIERTVAPAQDMVARARQSIANPNDANTIEAFAALWQ